MDAAAQLRTATAKRKDIEDQLTALQAELAGARAVEATWHRMLEGHEGGGTSVSRTDRILAILRGAPSGLGPTQIQEALAVAGGDDDNASVRGTLSYLKRQGLVTTVGRARWITLNPHGSSSTK